VGPGDNAIVIAPAYASSSTGIIVAGGEAREVPLAVDGDAFRLGSRSHRTGDRREYAECSSSTARTTDRLRILSRRTTRLLSLADRHDLTILSDESV